MIQAYQHLKLGNVLFWCARCRVIRQRRAEDGEHSEDGEREGSVTVNDTVTLGAPNGAKSAPQWVLVASELVSLKPVFISRGFAPQSVYCILLYIYTT
jgi:hypothetical protein